MSQGDELILDRRRHLDALGELGVPAYPNRFARTDSITALVEAHGGKSAEALDTIRHDAAPRVLYALICSLSPSPMVVRPISGGHNGRRL